MFQYTFIDRKVWKYHMIIRTFCFYLEQIGFRQIRVINPPIYITVDSLASRNRMVLKVSTDVTIFHEQIW